MILKNKAENIDKKQKMNFQRISAMKLGVKYAQKEEDRFKIEIPMYMKHA